MKLKIFKNMSQRAQIDHSVRSTIRMVVRSTLADDVLRLLSYEPGARRTWPEHVHQMRTSVRRLRSVLRFFGPVLADPGARRLREELRWLAGVLGAVRDLDVLEQRLRGAVVQLQIVSPSDHLFEEIDRRREVSQSNLVDALNDDRYESLRSTLITEAMSPVLADIGDRYAGKLLVDRLSRVMRRFLDDLESTPPDSPIEALHEFRKQAKRTRYTAESASEWLEGRVGRIAYRISRQAKQVQEILGTAQDAHVAIRFIREVMPTLAGDGPAHEAAVLLIDQQDIEAEEVLSQYRVLRDRILNE